MKKNYNIFKNKYKEKDEQPDYKISTKVGDSYVDVGACWLKETQNGEKFFSCQIEDEAEKREFTKENIPYPTEEEADPDRIPF